MSGVVKVGVVNVAQSKKARKLTDSQNMIWIIWIIPCNCLSNFNGLKSTLPRCAPQVLVIFMGRGKASFYGAGRASPVSIMRNQSSSSCKWEQTKNDSERNLSFPTPPCWTQITILTQYIMTQGIWNGRGGPLYN